MKKNKDQWSGLVLIIVLMTVTWCVEASAQTSSVCTLDRATGTSINKTPFIKGAGATRWNFATHRIAYMAPNDKGFYRVYTIPDSGGTPLEIDAPGMPEKHQGMESWHPSGRYIIMGAEKQDRKDSHMFGNPDYGSLPGWGMHDDLWLVTADGSKAWQLTNDPDSKTEGELMPLFSPDGKQVAWSSRQPGKFSYIIKVADFVETPQPHLENVRDYTPGGKHYYEPSAFTSDGRYITYTSDQETSFWASQIYILDLATGKSKRLTQGKVYNEHPVVVNTPTGDWIVYMSDKEEEHRFMHMPGTDWWAMRTDGSGTKRLTYMNIHTKDNPEAFDDAITATTVAVSPQGDTMIGDVQDSLVHQTGYSLLIKLTCN